MRVWQQKNVTKPVKYITGTPTLWRTVTDLVRGWNNLCCPRITVGIESIHHETTQHNTKQYEQETQEVEVQSPGKRTTDRHCCTNVKTPLLIHFWKLYVKDSQWKSRCLQSGMFLRPAGDAFLNCGLVDRIDPQPCKWAPNAEGPKSVPSQRAGVKAEDRDYLSWTPMYHERAEMQYH